MQYWKNFKTGCIPGLELFRYRVGYQAGFEGPSAGVGFGTNQHFRCAGFLGARGYKPGIIAAWSLETVMDNVLWTTLE